MEPVGQATSAGSAPAETVRAGPSSAVMALILLTLANVFNIADRLLLGVVQEPIKREFNLSDFELGLLGGLAFAVLYSILSIPIARLADRADRITIGAVALGVWSGMTALCGLATGYVHLFLARVGVSVGEAGGSAPALSYLADAFSPRRRATAMAIFALGGPVGALLATIAGGQLAQTYGWRAAFLALGGAGLVLALLTRLLLREVRAPGGGGERPKLLASLRLLARKRSFVHACATAVFATFTLTFIGQYIPSFLIRVHGLSIGQASLIFGIAGGIFGTLGTFLGGYVSDRAARRVPGARALVVAVAFVIAAFAYVATWWLPLAAAVPLLCLATFTGATFAGVNYAIVSAVAPPGQRATALAVLTLTGNILGYAVGPPVLGAVSDAAAAWELGLQRIDPARCAVEAATCIAGQGAGLRWALTLASILVLGGGFHQWRVSKTLAQDIED